MCVGVNILSREPSYHFCQYDEANVGVNESFFWIGNGLGGHHVAHGLYRSLLVFADRIVWNESSLMCQQVQDRDLVFPLGCKFRNVFCDRIGQSYASRFYQPHDAGCSGDRFCQRRQVEHGIGSHHLPGWPQLTVAISLLQDDPVASPDEYDATWHSLPCESFSDHGVDVGQPLCIHLDFCGGDLCQPWWRCAGTACEPENADTPDNAGDSAGTDRRGGSSTSQELQREHQQAHGWVEMIGPGSTA